MKTTRKMGEPWASCPVPDFSTSESLLDKPQMAQFLNISLSMLNKLISERRIEIIKLGRAVRFNKSKVLAELERKGSL